MFAAGFATRRRSRNEQACNSWAQARWSHGGRRRRSTCSRAARTAPTAMLPGPHPQRHSGHRRGLHDPWMALPGGGWSSRGWPNKRLDAAAVPYGWPLQWVLFAQCARSTSHRRNACPTTAFCSAIRSSTRRPGSAPATSQSSTVRMRPPGHHRPICSGTLPLPCWVGLVLQRWRHSYAVSLTTSFASRRISKESSACRCWA